VISKYLKKIIEIAFIFTLSLVFGLLTGALILHFSTGVSFAIAFDIIEKNNVALAFVLYGAFVYFVGRILRMFLEWIAKEDEEESF